MDAILASTGGWRATRLAEIRRAVLAAGDDVTESVKWVKPTNPLGVAAWSVGRLICTGEVYADKIKLTFAHGAKLKDPARLFNNGFSGNTRRAIDISEHASVDLEALTALVRQAALLD